MYSPLCYTVGPCWLSILHIILCICYFSILYIFPLFPYNNHKFISHVCGSISVLYIISFVSFDSTLTLLGIYLVKNIIQKDTRTLTYTAVLFTIAKTRKPPKYPSTDEWIKKMWYIHCIQWTISHKKMK